MNHSLGRVPVLGNLLGIGPLPAPGDGMTVNIGFYRHSNPYAQTVGASMRFIIDMSNAAKLRVHPGLRAIGPSMVDALRRSNPTLAERKKNQHVSGKSKRRT